MCQTKRAARRIVRIENVENQDKGYQGQEIYKQGRGMKRDERKRCLKT